MSLPLALETGTEVRRFREVFNAFMLARGTEVLGFRQESTNLHVRFRAAPAVPWVQVHVQSTAVGEGGVAAYDPLNFTSSTQQDCRSARVQDVLVSAITTTESYAIWLIPVQYDGDGTKILFDGQSGRPDDMSYVGLLPST